MRSILIAILRRSESARTSLNEPIETWPEAGRVYGKRTDLRDAEAIAAGQEASARVARFRVRENALTRTVTPRDRLSVAGEVWNITGMTRVPGRRRGELDITGVIRSDQDEV